MNRTWRNILFSKWNMLLVYCDRFVSTCITRLSLAFQGAVVGRGFRTSGRCMIKLQQQGSLVIGRGVKLYAAARSNRVGLSSPVLIETLDNGIVEIGDFSGGSSVVISCRSRVSIGRNVKMGGNVRIFDHDYHSLNAAVRKTSDDRRQVKSAPVSIGDDVFIGTNAIVLKGVTIGDRTVIGAGAVVVRDIPADVIAAGNPAVVVRQLGK